jgi:uncharacterized OB-fold protein
VQPGTTWSPENTAYWEAAKRGQLLVKKCKACGRVHYYPRAVCPFCASMQTEWVQSSGKGIVYSFTVVRQVAQPYVLAYVTLDEGITFLTNLVRCDPDKVRIGHAVQVTFEPSDDGRQIPMFALVD